MSARDPVQFTRESAERIAGVVRTIELTPTRGRGLNFDPVLEQNRRVFRMATFTGAWSINGTNVVTLANGATLAAVNRFFDHPNVGTRNCAVARDGTAWYLVQWQWNYTVTTVVTGANLGADALTFSRANVVVLDQSTATTVAISITTCSTAAT